MSYFWISLLGHQVDEALRSNHLLEFETRRNPGLVCKHNMQVPTTRRSSPVQKGSYASVLFGNYVQNSTSSENTKSLVQKGHNLVPQHRSKEGCVILT